MRGEIIPITEIVDLSPRDLVASILDQNPIKRPTAAKVLKVMDKEIKLKHLKPI